MLFEELRASAGEGLGQRCSGRIDCRQTLLSFAGEPFEGRLAAAVEREHVRRREGFAVDAQVIQCALETLPTVDTADATGRRAAGS